MAAFKTRSAVAAGHQPAVTPSGPSLAIARYGQSIAVADHAVGTKGIVGVLPAGTLLSYVTLSAPALGNGFKVSIGLLDSATGGISTAAADGGGAWVVDDTTGAAGGVRQVQTAAMVNTQVADEDRYVVMEITGAGSAAGLFTLAMAYHNA